MLVLKLIHVSKRSPWGLHVAYLGRCWRNRSPLALETENWGTIFPPQTPAIAEIREKCESKIKQQHEQLTIVIIQWNIHLRYFCKIYNLNVF